MRTAGHETPVECSIVEATQPQHGNNGILFTSWLGNTGHKLAFIPISCLTIVLFHSSQAEKLSILSR